MLLFLRNHTLMTMFEAFGITVCLVQENLERLLRKIRVHSARLKINGLMATSQRVSSSWMIWINWEDRP